MITKSLSPIFWSHCFTPPDLMGTWLYRNFRTPKKILKQCKTSFLLTCLIFTTSSFVREYSHAVIKSTKMPWLCSPKQPRHFLIESNLLSIRLWRLFAFQLSSFPRNWKIRKSSTSNLPWEPLKRFKRSKTILPCIWFVVCLSMPWVSLMRL